MCNNLEYPMCPGCGEPMRPFFHESPTGKTLANMTCDCGWVSPTAEGSSPQEALGAAYLLATQRCKAADNTTGGNEPKSHDPQDCAYYRIGSNGEPFCVGTKELDPCKGPTCERWRKRG